MSFDDVQSIWDSQQTPDGPMDRDGVLLSIVEKDRSLSRISTITDIVGTGTLLFVAAMFLRDPVLQGHDPVLIIPGIACLGAAGFVWKWRIDRRRRQLSFDDSLMGLINKSVDGLDDRIAHMNRFLWWFACPNLLGLVIALFIVDESKRYLLYTIFIPAFCACIGLAYWQIQREIRLKLQPEKERLEDLRKQLAREE
ncbi:MAG: hypothetical protein RIK87_20530 [Fuerstiella sp.]